MKRPSFQFYPADWRNNANLRRCSWEARGVWIEVMGLLHDSDTYGVLRWPLKEIAQALGAPVKLIQELATKGVMKGSDSSECEPFIYTPRSGRKDGDPVLLVPAQPGPIWYSSRMVKDEYVRSIRGDTSRFEESPKYSPKVPKGETPIKTPIAIQSDGSTATSSPTGISVGKPTGGKPPVDKAKAELWKAAVSLLEGQGMPEPQARTFIGKMSKDYPDGDIVLDAVRGAVAEQPADARAYIKATCQRLAGEKSRSGAPDWTRTAT